MNKDRSEMTSKEVARALYNTPIDYLDDKLKKITDKNTLKELRLLAYQRDNTVVMKRVDAHLKSIGLVVESF